MNRKTLFLCLPLCGVLVVMIGGCASRHAAQTSSSTPAASQAQSRQEMTDKINASTTLTPQQKQALFDSMKSNPKLAAPPTHP